MSNKIGITRKKIYDKEKNDGLVQSRIIIFKKSTVLKPGYVRVPKWILFALGTTIVLLSIILVSACFILFNKKEPATHLGDCNGRSCFPNLGLKCIEGKCQCEDGKYFTNKCNGKKANSAFCGHSNQCMSGLECKNGKCQCKLGEYWNGARCSSSKSHLETCSKNECLTSGHLYCNSTYG
jgi:hypothetical protein